MEFVNLIIWDHCVKHARNIAQKHFYIIPAKIAMLLILQFFLIL